MKAIKFIVTLFYLVGTAFVTYLIFSRNFSHTNLQFSVDSWTEENVLVILHSTWQSLLAIFCMGLCSMFTNFVFVRIIFGQEIKEAALYLLKYRKNSSESSAKEWIHQQTMKNKTWTQKLAYNLKTLI